MKKKLSLINSAFWIHNSKNRLFFEKKMLYTKKLQMLWEAHEIADKSVEEGECSPQQEVIAF